MFSWNWKNPSLKDVVKEVTTIKNDLGELGDQVHDIQADVQQFHNLPYGKKFTLTLPISTDTNIDMSSLFMKDGTFKNGNFNVVIRLVDGENLAFSFNMVNFYGTYSTIGCDFEFFNTRTDNGTKFSFNINDKGVMRCWTNAFACKLEIFAQQTTHKGDENVI